MRKFESIKKKKIIKMKRDSLGFDSNFLTSRDYYEDRKMKSGINLDED